MARDTTALSRRDVLKASGAAGAAGLTGLAGCAGVGGGGDSEYPALGNYPVEGDEVVFGFNVPQSGSYSQEGADELRGYNLAVEHLNNGGGWVDNWDGLSGDGVLGKTVTAVEGDTATDPDTARQSASRMISRDNAIMITGGSSSGVAIAVQELCQEEKVQFQCCITHSNDTTGGSCVRYSFREMFNAYMTGQALAPVLAEEYGEDLNFYQLYADYSWGQTQQASMEQFFTEVGNWSQIESVPTPLGTSDYSSYLSDVPRDETDVLVLNHYGLDAANSLPQAIEAGLDQDMEIVVPLYNRLMAEAASDSIGGIFGTADWNWQLEDDASQSFVEFYREEHDRAPSYGARIAYTQTLQYAAAVERAETFYAPEVIRELEGHEYSGAGLGNETMRGCDHQAQRDVLVCQGVDPSEQTEDLLLNIVSQTSRDDLGYACDAGPAAECELGDYGDE
ncbi:substrate-binding protein [Halobaculum roseum]|uniref:Substrate-binding protein n=1 Tax=Halobaculum roseum TaxID=2175149 RepID=A0ABD5MNK0_9EURY|nr:substrate-binding protein [Halobaculum roseum]QZY01746.1 substrate-binding protein [Halobaculum roseum]